MTLSTAAKTGIIASLSVLLANLLIVAIPERSQPMSLKCGCLRF